jgi:hypothetical protein
VHWRLAVPELTLANVESAAIKILDADTAITADVSSRVPNPRPASLIRVTRIGGDQLNMVQERAILLIECWGATQQQAWDLTAAAYKALQGRDPLEYNGIELSQRSCSSPVNYPDPSTTSPRYQFQLQTTVNLKGASS